MRDLYIATGNGTFDTVHIPSTELGDSIIKLLLDWYFAHGDQIILLHTIKPRTTQETSTWDLVVFFCFQISPAAIPISLLLAAKGRWMYEVDRDQMTLNNLHFCFNNCMIDPQIISEFQPNGRFLEHSCILERKHLLLWFQWTNSRFIRSAAVS